ncbi:hypothetical protein COCMIDRAFT_34602 [Bipolaris oryzae ATCC 44560]|uniref:DUF7587 domain-containing protein n=1 Tax=Bipolaris oryzae ATCC 44560 TaxID=930090 RepID=W6ZK83_COCMI|nr:uncharacterized protein COCMIDRAFT_34602 [Bipolaris oryzae ATCC 44560]EUC47864.1 hypothetical protein COCMIDRAFT_34602 [Bipolaris oryzae ATCC 44560]
MSGSSDRAAPASSSEDLSNLQSLAALRRIERAPPHMWDEDQRELLAILYRWYDNADQNTLPQVFNKVVGLDLRVSVIRHQFEGHVLLYGGRAFPEYARVMAIPFHDPEGRYNAICEIIEATAADSGIDLQRRDTEIAFNSGAARWAKSPRTRRLYRSLVRRAAQKEKEKGRISRSTQAVVLPSDQQEIPIPECLLGNIVLYTDDQDEGMWSDVENPSPSTALVEKLRSSIEPIRRKIALRVWDKNSRTIFSKEDGFVSQAFSIWRGEYPPPFTPDGEGRAALKLLTNLHLCLKGGASTFVSLSTSLLQALVKASTMDDPWIAIERMVWASVSAEAILHHFSISDLQNLADADDVCSQLLNLFAFQPHRRTRHVSDCMREQCNTITTHTVRAVASIARAFGMHRERVSLAHIQGFIAALIDSFQLRYNETGDAHSSNVAHNFAVTLRSRVHNVEEVALSFLEGTRQGNDVIAYYSRRRS